MRTLLFCLLIPTFAHAQWPGYFYAFTVTDDAGKVITKNDKPYRLIPVKPAAGDIMLDVLTCDDSTTTRFYVGGYHGLSDTHWLEIIRASTKEKMTIEFPSALSGGTDKYYRNLFVGKLIFRPGSYRVKLPASDSAWDNLHEIHFCPDYGGVDSYWDVSELQAR
jgi:hypothetical protein